jgi:hypothetical protein
VCETCLTFVSIILFLMDLVWIGSRSGMKYRGFDNLQKTYMDCVWYLAETCVGLVWLLLNTLWKSYTKEIYIICMNIFDWKYYLKILLNILGRNIFWKILLNVHVRWETKRKLAKIAENVGAFSKMYGGLRIQTCHMLEATFANLLHKSPCFEQQIGCRMLHAFS